MIKFNIENRTNLTMLANAYLDGLLPKAKKGEAFYDYNSSNEIKSIYFTSHDYYHLLIKTFKGKIPLMAESNAFEQWVALYEVLLSHKIVENVDYGNLEPYITESGVASEVIKEGAANIHFSKEDSFLKNVKRVYQSYEVTYWGKESLVVIKLPYEVDEVFTFDLKPLTDLLVQTEKNLINFNIYKDPSRKLHVIRIEID